MSKHASTAAAIQCSSASSKSHSDKESRYFQLMLLVLAAGAIYPILYLRQVYQTTMLEVFHINHSELGYLYSMLGTIFLLSYLPSGWLAGRPYRTALSDFLLAGRHRRPGPVVLHRAVDDRSDDHLRLLGPDHRPDLLGLGAQRVKMIAHHSEQGRFFGILDGGRGLVEALLATVAPGLFAFATETRGESAAEGFNPLSYQIPKNNKASLKPSRIPASCCASTPAGRPAAGTSRSPRKNPRMRR